MGSRMLAGVGRHMISVPFLQFAWAKVISRAAGKIETSLRRFMTDEHHLVRDFVVRELPRIGAPLSPETIAEGSGLPEDRVEAILEELERRLLFLVRNDQGAVTWAYPATIDETPHAAVFGNGDRVHLA